MKNTYAFTLHIDLLINKKHKEVHVPLMEKANNSIEATNQAICKCGLREDEEYNYEFLQKHLEECGVSEVCAKHCIESIGISLAKEIQLV